MDDVKKWQEKLTDKFTTLSENRRKIKDARVFAIEHELREEEIKDLFTCVNKCLYEKLEIKKYWLLLVVVATEVGYSFRGDEYWQTFEKKVPNWKNSDRKYLRNCFEEFKEKYLGVVPSGKWAESFTIIAWPVTHAILPLDIQRHFLESLYKLRFSLRSEHFENKELLAYEIESQSINLTSRFKNFLGNKLLAWQFFSALQTGRSDGLKLSQLTFNRIVSDLEKEESSREQLKDIRHKIHQISNRTTSTGGGRVSGDEMTHRYNFHPHINLKLSDNEKYDLYIRTPKLSSYFTTCPDLKNDFLRYRFRFQDESNSYYLSSNLLDSRNFKLKKWPKIGASLLKPIDCDNLKVKELYKKVKIKTKGTAYLFKLQKNGMGTHLVTGVLNPGYSYILVSENIKPLLGKGVPVNFNFEGAQGIKFKVTEAGEIPFSDKELKDLNLCNVSCIDVWPAGIAPSQWDGGDFIEWLSTDTPILAIRASDKVNKVTINLQQKELTVPLEDNEIKFIELPNLCSGTYSIHFCSHSKVPELDKVCFKINIVIRDPYIWERGSSPCYPLMISLDPLHPNYEDLINSNINIEVDGPYELKIDATIEFYQKHEKKKPLLEKSFPVTLPLNSSKWDSLFTQYIKEKNQLEKIDEAHSCKLNFKAKEFGTSSIYLEREQSVLRWCLQKSKRKIQLKLIDDTDSCDESRVLYYPLKTPDTSINLDFYDTLKGIDIKNKTGLFFAEANGNKSTVIANGIKRKVHSFKDFFTSHENIKIKNYNIQQLPEIIELLRLWHSSSITGLLELDKQNVISELTKSFFSTIGGESWRLIESKSKKENTYPPLEMFKELKLEKWKCKGIASYIRNTFEQELMNKKTPQRVCWFAIALDRFHMISKSQMEFDHLYSLSELCLQLASHSDNIFIRNGQIENALNVFYKRPAIPLLARYLVFSINSLDNVKYSHINNFYFSWRW